MKILLATDGSTNSEAAANLLFRLPLPEGVEMTLLTVVEAVRPLFAGEHPIIGSDVREAFKRLQAILSEGARRVLQREEKRLHEKGLAVRPVTRQGHVADQIIQACRELNCDLLVIGSRGLGGFKGLLLGSVSQRMLRHAPCSVLIARPRAAAGRRNGDLPDQAPSERLRILLAFDGSPDAHFAADMLKSLPLGGRVEVTVLTVIPEMSRYGLDRAAVRLLTEVWEGEKEAAQAAADGVARQLESATPYVTAQLRLGDPTRQILAAARETGADIIMLGTRGRSAMAAFHLGSVSAHVAWHSPFCSVWIAKAPV